MLRAAAKMLSLIFHPLLMLTYMTGLLLLINPYGFGVNSIRHQIPLLLVVFFSSFLIPGISVFLMKLLGLVQSAGLQESRDRIGPYIVAGVFYLWLYINFRNDSKLPAEFGVMVLGVVIALFLAFFINNFNRISIHATGMGSLMGMLLSAISLYGGQPVFIGGFLEINLVFLFLLAILFSGLVGTARLFLEPHDPADLYGGYLVGAVSQMFAFKFFL